MIYAKNTLDKEHRIAVAGSSWPPPWRLIEADADGWIPHDDDKCPLPYEQPCELRTHTGHQQAFDKAGAVIGWKAAVRYYRPILDTQPEAPEWDGEQRMPPSRESHPDDLAVDRFSEDMKAKLAVARAKGRDGWDNHALCSGELLADMLVGHVGKSNAGNLADIANLAMMLHQRGDDPAVVATSLTRLKAQWQVEALEEADSRIAFKHAGARIVVRKMADELRRQAEGDS